MFVLKWHLVFNVKIFYNNTCMIVQCTHKNLGWIMSTQPWTNVHLPLNFHFPDTKHVKHIIYIHVLIKISLGSRISYHRKRKYSNRNYNQFFFETPHRLAQCLQHILAIQYNGVIASPDLCPLRFAYQVSHRLAGLWGGSFNIYYISEAISTAQDLLCI